MTTPSDTSKKDGSFSSFSIGVALGVMGALLLGTEEGRNIIKKVVKAVPNKYKTPPVNIPHPVTTMPIIPTEETPHHTTFEHSTPFGDTISEEAPPPPAPLVRPTRPEPFTPNSYPID